MLWPSLRDHSLSGLYTYSAAMMAVIIVLSIASRAASKTFKVSFTVAERPAMRKIARTTGIAGFALFSLLFVALFVPPLHFYGLSLEAGFVALGLTLVLLNISAALRRPLLLPTAVDVLRRDTRAPVLYLRSFSRESRRATWRRMFRSLGGSFATAGRVAAALSGDDKAENVDRILAASHRKSIRYGGITFENIGQSLLSGRGQMYDEQLALANVMNGIGPYIGIARPSESTTWADVGAAKQRVSDDRWKDVVAELMAISALIVLEAGNSLGLMWEVEQVVRIAPPRKVLLFLPDSDADYAAFIGHTRTMFPKALPALRCESRFIAFDETWTPQILPLDSWSADPFAPFLSFDRVLHPFFKKNGYTVRRQWKKSGVLSIFS